MNRLRGQQAAAQAETAGDASSPATPPEIDRWRIDYLRGVGINKCDIRSRGASRRPPRAVEVPDVQKPKGREEFRVHLLKRLSDSKVWTPTQRPLKSQHIFIFDWDDTLLCTSHLYSRGGPWDSCLPREAVRHLKDVQRAVKRLLERAAGFGPTFVITNAREGWVQFSAAYWMPEVLDVLQKQNVRIISARANHEPQHPGDIGQWKVEAFLEVQRELNSQIVTALYSFGDSTFEMDAVHVMGREFSHSLVKTCKFIEDPSPKDLLMQLELVDEWFERIVFSGKSAAFAPKRVGGAQQR